MSDHVHLLMMSAGSLVAQNVYDALEGRREQVRITGVNLDADVPRLYRSDRVRLVPRLDDPAFALEMAKIVEDEQPDLIVPGRDHDIQWLADRVAQEPDKWPAPVGLPEVIRMMNDKSLSYRWAQAQGLPFVDTLVLDETSREEQDAWVAEHRFPLLAKPKSGFGSLGVRILRRPEHWEALREKAGAGLIVQELLGEAPQWESQMDAFEASIETGVPLFFILREEIQYNAQLVLGPQGFCREPMTAISHMIMGRCEYLEPIIDAGFQKLAEAFGQALYEAGWRGIVNLQFRRQDDGSFIAHEMNGRISGGTSARRWFGFDEVRMLIEAFTGKDIGEVPGFHPEPQGRVMRSLRDDFLPQRAMDELTRTRRWEASK